MTSSKTNLIVILALAAGLVSAQAASAKGPGGSGGSHFNSARMMSSSSSSSFAKSAKLNNNFVKSNQLSSNNFVKSNQLNSNFIKSDKFKVSPIKKDLLVNKNGNLKIDLSKSKKIDPKFDKNFCKKDFCWFDKYCYWNKHCYPWYFGCSYPWYSCYDYCYPTYCSTSYLTSPIYVTPSYVSSITVLPTAEPARVRVALGSVLLVNGQAFGDKAGGARLRVSGMALPIEIVEWTPSAVKVRLPQVELAGTTAADIEVIRPDGSMASKTTIELMPVAEQLALNP
jgi:hypothetical protein